MGRPVCAAFEAHVKALLVLEEGGHARVNVAYGYAVIRLAARAAQALPQWRAHPRVAGLSFSDKWVCGWLHRAGLRRRRVTSVEKVPPPAAAVDARMREIQARIVAGGFAPCNVRSADETGVWYGAAPKNQYVGAGVRRGSAPPSDDRARFTAHPLSFASSWQAGAARRRVPRSLRSRRLQARRVLPLQPPPL